MYSNYNFVNFQGSKKVEGIYLHRWIPVENVLKPKAFQPMHNLRFLIVSAGGVNLKALDYLPPLKYLEWIRYPLTKLPSDFDTHDLVELHLEESELEQLWPDGDQVCFNICSFNIYLLKQMKAICFTYCCHLFTSQDLTALKTIDLSYSKWLIRIPEVSRALNLERIILSSCRNLVEFPRHNLRNLDKLVDLNLEFCVKIRYPTDRIDRRTLQNINLNHWPNFDSLLVILPTSLVSLDFKLHFNRELALINLFFKKSLQITRPKLPTPHKYPKQYA